MKATIFSILLVMFLLAGCLEKSNYTFILPYNFKCKVILTFDIENSNNNKTFIVPKNGKIETSVKYSEVFLNNKFYILDSLGKKKRLFVINRNDKVSCEKLGILNERTHLHGNTNNKNSKYSYIFNVGSKNDMNWCRE